MKRVTIQARGHFKIRKQIHLGNGYLKTFDSLREAGYFVAETNRFLTDCLVILNLSYAETFRLYRDMWFVAANNKTGTQTQYFQTEQKIKSFLSAADFQFDKFNTQFGSNDDFFAFIDIKKAALFLSEALETLETFNKKRNLTAAMYAAGTLRKRCLLVMEHLNNYPKKKAWEPV